MKTGLGLSLNLVLQVAGQWSIWIEPNNVMKSITNTDQNRKLFDLWGVVQIAIGFCDTSCILQIIRSIKKNLPSKQSEKLRRHNHESKY